MPPILGRAAISNDGRVEFPLFGENEPSLLNPVEAPGIKDEVEGRLSAANEQPKKPYKMQIVWRNVVIYVLLHTGAVYGLYLLFAQAMWQTMVFTFLMYLAGGLGITAGAHRLWSHKSYKANGPYRFLIMLFNCIALEDDVITWARDHRVHHKFTETDADPYNARRGFFFSHAGWLLVRKHPMVREFGQKLDMSDLTSDPVLQFQKRHYNKLALGLCFVMPTIVPWYFWGESPVVAYFTAGVFRYVFGLNMTWTVNSLAHMWGSKPYDFNIFPTQNFTCIVGALGEGFHNYHHVYPWDYRASEYGIRLNLTTFFIDFFAKLGWVSDRKIVNQDSISKKKLKSGQPQDTIKHKYIYG